MQFEYGLRAWSGLYFFLENYNRHVAIISMNAAAPYRYRILSNAIVEAVARHCFGGGVHGFFAASFCVRFAQNTLIFALLLITMRRVYGCRLTPTMIGLTLYCFSLWFALYMSDLSFYTYTEVILFQLAIIALSYRRTYLIIPISIVAALNRESSVFIPILLLSSCLAGRKIGSCFTHGLAALALFAATQFLLRLAIGVGVYSGSRYGDVYPGLALAYLNTRNTMTWVGVLGVFNLSLMGLVWYRRWPGDLKIWLLAVALPWCLAQWYFGSTDEARLFLVPMATTLLPAFVTCLDRMGTARQPTGDGRVIVAEVSRASESRRPDTPT